MFRYVKPLVAAKVGLVAFVLSGAVAQPYRVLIVSGDSMYPNYTNESIHFSRRVSRPLYRGEVVVLRTGTATLIKRIAFLPGDVIHQLKIKDGWTDIVGIAIPRSRSSKFVKIRNVTLPPDKVYVLGDNRPRSEDSRSFGPVPVSDIVGEVLDQKRYAPERVPAYPNPGERSNSTGQVSPLTER